MNNDNGKSKKGSKSNGRLPIVGIGASAGGLKALKQFFDNVPADSGLAYVVVLHLSPEHKSVLAELLQPHVNMPVRQVNKTIALEANNVYVIPPNANLNTIDTHLRLTKLEEKRSDRAPIDHFFRTLSKTHDGHAIGIILTGTGSDGTLGIKEIKEKGGLTIVQDPGEAEYDGMPQNAISTGLVDMVLPIAEMPRYLVNFISTTPRLKFFENEKPEKEENLQIQKIFTLVKTHTNRDFSCYKLSTLMRRIQRRMQIYQLEQLEKYIELLRKNQEEVKALSDDFLINVTSFFRDAQIFEFLEKNILPNLIKSKNADEQIRVWSVGCATGEEAYSLAILLNEAIAREEISPSVQIFASDLHEASLKKAREGFFPGDIKAEVNDERLARFFMKEDGGYRIRKELREQVIFTPHNLLSDPPFSRLDMVVCRNLLIYLKKGTQRDVIELFHYALRSNSYLVLGTSESLEDTSLFVTESKEVSVYRKNNITGPEPKLPVFPKIQKHFRSDIIVEKPQDTISFGVLHQRLLERFGPPSLLVSPDYQVLNVSEAAGKYLLVQRGELSRDLFKLIRDELSLELRSAIHATIKLKKEVRTNPVELSIDGVKKQVEMVIHLLEEKEYENTILIIFEESKKKKESRISGLEIADADSKFTARIRELDEELRENRQRLQTVIEEYETSREEMKASNEELQSANEELRSTLEELETSKEELQSVNEELTTLNQENQHKVEELSQLSDDLVNLLAATDIATLFLNRELRIMRYTPKLNELFNIRLADRGRPISDITNKLWYEEMNNDAKKVLEKLQTIEREIKDNSGNTYLTTLLPYRSADDKIEGVVITFLDITKRKQAEEVLKESEQLYRTLYSNIDDGFMMVEPVFGKDNKISDDYLIKDVNKVWERQTGLKADDVLGKKIKDTLAPMEGFRAENFGKVSRTGKPLHIESRNKESGNWYDLYAFNYKQGQVGVFSRDITQRKKLEHQIKENEELYRALFDNTEDGFVLCEPVFNNKLECTDLQLLNINSAFKKQSGLDGDSEFEDKRISEIWQGLDAEWYNNFDNVIKSRKSLRFEAFNKQFGKWFEVYGFPFKEKHVGVFFKDISGRKKVEQQWLDINKSLEEAVADRTARLKENEALLKGIAEAQAISLTALKAIRNKAGEIVDFEVLFANKMTEMITGIKKITGQQISQIKPELLKTELFLNCCHVVDTGKEREDEYYFERDGIEIWIRTISVKMSDGVVVNTEDITTRKQTEIEFLKMRDELTSRASNRYKLLFDSMNEGFCILNVLYDKKDEPVDYRLIEANPAFEKLTGLTDIEGKRIRDLVSDIDQSWFDILGQSIRNRKTMNFEKQIGFLDNRWFDIFMIPIKDDHNQQLAILFTEITERKNLEQKIDTLSEPG